MIDWLTLTISVVLSAIISWVIYRYSPRQEKRLWDQINRDLVNWKEKEYQYNGNRDKLEYELRYNAERALNTKFQEKEYEIKHQYERLTHDLQKELYLKLQGENERQRFEFNEMQKKLYANLQDEAFRHLEQEIHFRLKSELYSDLRHRLKNDIQNELSFELLSELRIKAQQILYSSQLWDELFVRLKKEFTAIQESSNPKTLEQAENSQQENAQ